MNQKPVYNDQSRKYYHRRVHTEMDEPLTYKQHKQQPKYFYHPGYYNYKSRNNNYAAVQDKNQDNNNNNYQPKTRQANQHRRTNTKLENPTNNVHPNNYNPYNSKNSYNFRDQFKQQYSKPAGSYYAQTQKYVKTQTGMQKQPTIPKMVFKYSKNSQMSKYNIKNKVQKNTTAQGSADSASNQKSQIKSKYQIEGIAGKGTFGVVYFGKNRFTGQKIAIKKVLQDKKYKNRQLEILKQVKHKNLLEMKEHYFTHENNQQYLNVIMDYFPDNLYQAIKKKPLNPLIIKLYTYQILRGLNYFSMHSIAHRDIKPQNILVDQQTLKLVVCDFGSAKKLVKGEPNIAYICSRCYRAPQLIFGATQYTSQIDMWSTGCVIVQMINGEAPFLGDSQLDQLLQIIKVLGTPMKSDIQQMNPKYDLKDYKKIPNVKPVAWHKILKTDDALLIDLIKKILEYSPLKRFSAAQALNHPYFQQLHNQQIITTLSEKYQVPFDNLKQLFQLSQQQKKIIEKNNVSEKESMLNKPSSLMKQKIILNNFSPQKSKDFQSSQNELQRKSFQKNSSDLQVKQPDSQGSQIKQTLKKDLSVKKQHDKWEKITQNQKTPSVIGKINKNSSHYRQKSDMDYTKTTKFVDFQEKKPLKMTKPYQYRDLLLKQDLGKKQAIWDRFYVVNKDKIPTNKEDLRK